MLGLPLVDQRDLEIRVGADNVAKMCNDEGGTEPDPEILDALISRGSGLARTALRRAFPEPEQVAQLVASDDGVKVHVEDLVIGLMGDRRPGLLAADGKTPYSAFRARGMAALKAIADAELRPEGEETTGRNKLVETSMRPARAQREPVFLSTAKNPHGRRGGF